MWFSGILCVMMFAGVMSFGRAQTTWKDFGGEFHTCEPKLCSKYFPDDINRPEVPVPFSSALPDKFPVNQAIVITGRPFGHKFSIRIIKGKRLIWRLATNLQTNKTSVTGTPNKGKRRTDIIPPEVFPLSVGEEFTLEIQVSHQIVSVTVSPDGQVFTGTVAENPFYIRERRRLKLNIRGAVQVYSIDVPPPRSSKDDVLRAPYQMIVNGKAKDKSWKAYRMPYTAYLYPQNKMKKHFKIFLSGRAVGKRFTIELRTSLADTDNVPIVLTLWKETKDKVYSLQIHHVEGGKEKSVQDIKKTTIKPNKKFHLRIKLTRRKTWIKINRGRRISSGFRVTSAKQNVLVVKGTLRLDRVTFPRQAPFQTPLSEYLNFPVHKYDRYSISISGEASGSFTIELTSKPVYDPTEAELMLHYENKLTQRNITFLHVWVGDRHRLPGKNPLKHDLNGKVTKFNMVVNLEHYRFTIFPIEKRNPIHAFGSEKGFQRIRYLRVKGAVSLYKYSMSPNLVDPNDMM